MFRSFYCCFHISCNLLFGVLSRLVLKLLIYAHLLFMHIYCSFTFIAHAHSSFMRTSEFSYQDTCSSAPSYSDVNQIYYCKRACLLVTRSVCVCLFVCICVRMCVCVCVCFRALCPSSWLVFQFLFCGSQQRLFRQSCSSRSNAVTSFTDTWTQYIIICTSINIFMSPILHHLVHLPASVIMRYSQDIFHVAKHVKPWRLLCS